MTTTLLTQQSSSVNTKTCRNTTNMIWSNEKLRLSCIDNISLKQLWKLIALDSTNSSNSNTPTNLKNRNIIYDNQESIKKDNKTQQKDTPSAMQQNSNATNHQTSNHGGCENFEYYMANRDFLTPKSMSLLKFFAINTLELSAPATPVLLQQKSPENYFENLRPQGWLQLSGHPESIVPTNAGVVRKRINNVMDNEVRAYSILSSEPQTAQIVPHFYGTVTIGNQQYIELQDLLSGFKDPCVMDIKLGCRTFLESEVTNKTLRPDLYKKMVAVDPDAPTEKEHADQAITKLRYMLFREAMSSSDTKCFRIEAMRLRGHPPTKDMKKVRHDEQVQQTIKQFLSNRKVIKSDIIKRLKKMRRIMESSQFFRTHEVVGSSIFMVYDDHNFGVWLIDFAKSRQVPAGVTINHRDPWTPGNSEEGILKGMDELIKSFENCSFKKNIL